MDKISIQLEEITIKITRLNDIIFITHKVLINEKIVRNYPEKTILLQNELLNNR